MKKLQSEDPDQIGPFEIIARLGAGGMGVVFLGTKFVAPEYLMERLKPWCEGKGPDEYVFQTSKATPLRNSNFSKRIYKPALATLGFPNLRLHDLRHTAVSVAKSAGGDIFDVKNQVGHSDIRTTINTYGHIFEEDSLDLAKKMDVALKNVH